MLCDKYKEALIEAAASGAALPSALSEHVSFCADCREIFAAQQSMFALVDAELRSRANVTVPGNFHHRVRAALQGETAQDRKRHSAILGFGWLAAAAALLLSIVWTQNLKHGARDPAGNSVVESKLVASPESSALSGNGKGPVPSSPPRGDSRVSTSRSEQPSKASLRRHDEPEVLVPQGQEELLAKYMEGMAARKARVTFSADLQHEPNMKPVEVPSIEISELVVKPLPDLSSN